MSKATAPLVIYFDRKKIDLYIGDQNKIVSWQLPETIFHHLEILDAPAFRKLFEAAITANKIAPTKIIVIFSQNIVFAVDLPMAEAEASKRELILTQFREQVPFASPFVKEVKLEKKELAIALNRDLFELLVAQLKSLGFDVTTLVTSHILPFEVPATGITPALALEAIKAWGRLESHDFLEPEQKKGMISSREQQDPGERNRIYMLVGVFVVLILLLGGVIFYSMQQSKKDQEAAAALKAEMAQKAAEEAAVVPSIAPTVEPTAVPGQLTPELAAARAKYSITVYEPTTPVIEADAVVTALEEAGFSKVRTISNYAAATSALRITVDDTVSSQDRLGLKDILAAFDSSVNIKTVTGSEANIVIVLPK